MTAFEDKLQNENSTKCVCPIIANAHCHYPFAPPMLFGQKVIYRSSLIVVFSEILEHEHGLFANNGVWQTEKEKSFIFLVDLSVQLKASLAMVLVGYLEWGQSCNYNVENVQVPLTKLALAFWLFLPVLFAFFFLRLNYRIGPRL